MLQDWAPRKCQTVNAQHLCPKAPQGTEEEECLHGAHMINQLSVFRGRGEAAIVNARRCPVS